MSTPAASNAGSRQGRRRFPLNSDQVFTAAFGVSLAVHLLLLLGQLLRVSWLTMPRIRTPLEVIYDQEVVAQELRYLQERLSKAKTSTAASPAPPNPTNQTQVRIPDRPALTADQTLAEIMPGHATIVDLTNLVDASQGNPVLLSYFSAIREQIQQAANSRTWLPEAGSEGLVYVSFELDSSGTIRGASIVSDRSAGATALQDAALRIVQHAAPFPPFPPSMPEASKTIVVPLEFLLSG